MALVPRLPDGTEGAGPARSSQPAFSSKSGGIRWWSCVNVAINVSSLWSCDK